MSTKTEISTYQNTNLADASNITAVEHREVLNTEQHSILEQIYPDVIIDTHLTTNVLTLVPGVSCEYRLEITKQGRTVLISGWVLSQQGGLSSFATVTNSEFEISADSSYSTTGTITINSASIGETSTINIFRIGATTFLGASNLLNNEKITFQIKYNVEN